MYANMYTNMEDSMYPIAEYTNDQHGIPQQNNVLTYNQMVSGYPTQDTGAWIGAAPVYEHSLQYPRLSVSMRSSVTPDPRVCNANDFSSWQRSSMASTTSSWSSMSDQAHRRRRSSLASIGPPVDQESPVCSNKNVSATDDDSSHSPQETKRKPKHRQVASERDPFATCVSRTRRTRRSHREPRYWCTACEEPFVEKYDWKRHEETYQERRFVYRCNLCSAVYFLEKDFLYHHVTRHHCETCSREGHLETATQDRQVRTGWGCGFCTHFSTNWRDRCNHIAQHFEKDGKTMRDWHNTKVIDSLLQRPAIQAEWYKILRSQPQLRGPFGWRQCVTGRVEGYPENSSTPHLQDRLEYFTSSDDAATLAQLAFSEIAFPSQPPQAPRKDYKDNHTVTLQSLREQTESWNHLISAIPDESLLSVNAGDFGFGFDTTDNADDCDTRMIQ